MNKKAIDDSCLDNFDDLTLVKLAKDNNKQAFNTLALRYIRIIRKKASAVSLSSMDIDDITQEGFIGLLDAVSGFDPDKQFQFSTYANICVDNRIKKAIAKANTKKNSVLNNSLNLDDISKTIVSVNIDPQNIYMEKEMFIELQKQLKSLLSSFEQEVLSLYLNGKSYDAMAEKLGSTNKSVDNALQRIRRKLKIASI